jgi:hypothetical protein
MIPALSDGADAASRSGSGRKLTPGEVSSFWLHRALRWAAEHPADFARLQLRKLGRFFDWYEQPDAVDYYWVRGIAPVYRLPLIEFSTLSVLAVAGLWLSRRELRRFLPCLLFATGWIASTVAFFVFSRYRLPLVPAILPLAALPLAAGWDAWRTRRRGWAFAALGIAAAFSLSSVPYAPRMDLVEYNLGRLAEERGDEAGALLHYQAAYDDDPRNFLACLNLGTPRCAEAIGRPRFGLPGKPGLGRCRTTSGEPGSALWRQARPMAAAHFENALRLNPQNRARPTSPCSRAARGQRRARALIGRLSLDRRRRPPTACECGAPGVFRLQLHERRQ